MGQTINLHKRCYSDVYCSKFNRPKKTYQTSETTQSKISNGSTNRGLSRPSSNVFFWSR